MKTKQDIVGGLVGWPDSACSDKKYADLSQRVGGRTKHRSWEPRESGGRYARLLERDKLILAINTTRLSLDQSDESGPWL